mmetsp:Transcript_92959/g.199363  ORF Transcript_92959/g.199363 Transcript_92959/m.199363 type:complete len:212 (-) Transcript_92959:1637-2272(-)
MPPRKGNLSAFPPHLAECWWSLPTIGCTLKVRVGSPSTKRSRTRSICGWTSRHMHLGSMMGLFSRQLPPSASSLPYGRWWRYASTAWGMPTVLCLHGVSRVHGREMSAAALPSLVLEAFSAPMSFPASTACPKPLLTLVSTSSHWRAEAARAEQMQIRGVCGVWELQGIALTSRIARFVNSIDGILMIHTSLRVGEEQLARIAMGIMTDEM